MKINTENSLQNGDPITFTSNGKVLSRRYHDRWDFSGIENRASGKKPIVSFRAIDPIYRRKIQETLADLYFFLKNKNLQAPTSEQLQSWKLGMSHLAVALKTTQWTEIDKRIGFRNFKANLKQLKLSQNSLDNVVKVLNKFFEIGIVKRIIDGRELLAFKSPKPAKQHIAVPIGMYKRLLSCVISNVETYYTHRHEISRVMKEAYDIKGKIRNKEDVLNTGLGRPIISHSETSQEQRVYRAYKLLIKHNIPNFAIDLSGKQLGILQNSCAMTIMAFSGVRVGELTSFNAKSYELKETEVGKEISVLVGKTTKGNNGIPKTATWQTHPIAKDALELAYDMMDSSRDYYKRKIETMLESGQFTIDHYQHAISEVESAFIPTARGKQKITFVSQNMSHAFNELMKSFDIQALKEDVDEFNTLNPTREGTLKVGGHLPKLTPHDFRRTFAVFFKRYGFGTTAGIKFQYKHTNLNMSDYYANNADLIRMHDVLLDTDLLKIMQEEGIKLGVEIYDDIFNNSEHLSGGGGERIAQDKFKKLQAGHKVYMHTSEIEPLIRNGSLAVVQLPTGAYCTNSECERLCGMGLFAGAKRKCEHTVNTDKSAKVMAQQRKRDIDKFRGLNTGDTKWNSILARIKQNIKELEVVLREHEVPFEPFTDRVEGLINV
ncbi:hypothetical protein [Paraglaciecola sp. 2405UD69-4]|uniref:hypothetical protein n=1 Tax=Paraglaciecola sp. 2405UD69-4 TaxID=3391836 RepID=UPI0039C9E80F